MCIIDKVKGDARKGLFFARKSLDNNWGRAVLLNFPVLYDRTAYRLGIGGHSDSVFVLHTDVDRNIIYIGQGHDHKGLSRSCLVIRPDEIHWIRPELRMEAGEMRRYRVRVRYRQPLQDAALFMRECGLFILFDSPKRGITPGQFAAWYSGDGELCGSGVISR